MCNNSKPAFGFTLLELIVAISIAGVLVAIAIPSFSTVIRNNRLTTYANELVTALNLARSEAVKRGVSVSVRKATCEKDTWGDCGWNVFVDSNENGTFDKDVTGEEILRTYDKLPNAFTLAGNTFTGFAPTEAGKTPVNSDFVNFVRYQADGTIGNTNRSRGSFALCADSNGNSPIEPYTSRLIIVNTMGRIRMGLDKYDKDGNPKPDGIAEKDDNKNFTLCTLP
jgi:type IV fimbrial biogenesis protein FimT